MAAVRSAEKSDLALEVERALRVKKTKKDGWWERMRERAQVRVPKSDIERADDECRVCGAQASDSSIYPDNFSIYPDIAGFLCDTCLGAEITAADPNYIDAIESETEMPLSVALDFSAKAQAKAAAIRQTKLRLQTQEILDLAAKAHRHKPPGPNMGIQGFAFPTVTPTYNGARYRWLMQGWELEFLANPYYPESNDSII